MTSIEPLAPEEYPALWAAAHRVHADVLPPFRGGVVTMDAVVADLVGRSTGCWAVRSDGGDRCFVALRPAGRGSSVAWMDIVPAAPIARPDLIAAIESWVPMSFEVLPVRKTYVRLLAAEAPEDDRFVSGSIEARLPIHRWHQGARRPELVVAWYADGQPRPDTIEIQPARPLSETGREIEPLDELWAALDYQERRVRMRPYSPQDHAWLYDAVVADAALLRWLFGGVVPAQAAFVQRMDAGVDHRFVLVGADGNPIGVTFAYDYSPLDAHVYVAVVLLERYRGAGWPIEGVLAFLGRCFASLSVTKVYVEVSDARSDMTMQALRRFAHHEGQLIEHEGDGGPTTDQPTFAIYRSELSGLATRLGILR